MEIIFVPRLNIRASTINEKRERFEISVPFQITIFNPLSDIDDAKTKDYFWAIILAVFYFEYYGFIKLKNIFKNRISEEKLENLSVSQLAILLFGLSVINQPTYTKMIEVIQERNKLVHPKGKLTKRFNIDPKEIEHLLKKAKEVIKKLQ